VATLVGVPCLTQAMFQPRKTRTHLPLYDEPAITRSNLGHLVLLRPSGIWLPSLTRTETDPFAQLVSSTSQIGGCAGWFG